MTETYTRVTGYTVSALPEGLCVDSYLWDIEVEYRGKNRWAVTYHSQCLNTDNEWDHEWRPSERPDEWLVTHRFTEEEALARARLMAPKVVINGISTDDLLARNGIEGVTKEEVDDFLREIRE